MSGRTVKIVIVGSAGVGKTSLRHQYTSGRFATGYRATIGTDFISKTVPHYSQAVTGRKDATLKDPQSPNPPGESPEDDAAPAPEPVTLQIWDTAGQERFSSLSTAFFRGADAVILVYDVNRPETLTDLGRWWNEFRVKVPIEEGEEPNYCVVVVGNKTDLAPMTVKAGKPVIGSARAVPFLQKMIPVPNSEDVIIESPSQELPPTNLQSLPSSPLAERAPTSSSLSITRPPPQPLPTRPADAAETTVSTPRPSTLSSVIKSPTKFGTMTSTRTGLSVYHTPSSSLFDSPSTSRLPGARASPNSSRSPSSSRRRHASEGHDPDSSMDLEFDYTYDVNVSSSSMSGYATAKSTPGQSPSDKSSLGDDHPLLDRRLTINSVVSQSSLSTVRPPAGPSVAIRQELPRSELTPALSPTRSRASTISSASTGTLQHIIAADLPTPSASPPSPPVLTASLMATLHQQRQTEILPSVQNALDVGPKLFFTSAKTLAIRPDNMPLTPIAEIFAYISERVVRRWEWEETRLELQDTGDDEYQGGGTAARGSLTVRLSERWKGFMEGRSGCCAS